MSDTSNSEAVDLLERFTQRARMVMGAAYREAKRSGSACIGTEHVLMGLLIEKRSTGIVADKLGQLKPADIRSAMEKKVGTKARIEELLRVSMSMEALNALEFAIEESRLLNHTHVTSEHLLLGLLREPNGPAAQLLNDAGIDAGRTYRELREFLVGARTVVVNANVVHKSLRKKTRTSSRS